MFEGRPGGISSAQLPHGYINVPVLKTHKATTVALVIERGDRLDIMRSICEVSLSIHCRLVKKGAGKAWSSYSHIGKSKGDDA
jgi:hypothetical protein